MRTLFVYDIYNGRLVFAVALGFPGLISLVTPVMAELGGYHVTAINRFFTGLYSAILTPVIPALVNIWFLPSELYRMNICIFLGVECGRMFFCLTGAIVDSVGWQFLFFIPGALSIVIAIIFYIFMTDDPLENSWLTPQEKEMVAVSQKRQFVAREASSSKFDHYRRQMKFKNKQKGKKQPPWKKIFCTRMLWVATLQATAQAWSGIMMILMAKEYLEEVHGYSLQEAAIAVTIPNNLAQFLLGLCVGYLGDWLIKMRVSEVAVRRVGAAVQILAILPLLVLPFLPCSAIAYRATMWAVQVTPPLHPTLHSCTPAGDL